MLYDSLIRYGDCYRLNITGDPDNFLNNITKFKDDWKPYNPRKNIKRYGLSITSLDGGLSGIPDIDSVREYNLKNNVRLREPDFKTKTPVYPHAAEWLDLFKNDLGRTHVIKMPIGGCFPPHRDDYAIENDSFRLFIPLKNCKYPQMFFILDNKILNFDHGCVYFINTCKEHTVFTVSDESTFIVANIILSERSVETVLNNLSIT